MSTRKLLDQSGIIDREQEKTEKKAGYMENNFKQLGIEDSILKSLDSLEFNTPTEVQRQAISQGS